MDEARTPLILSSTAGEGDADTLSPTGLRLARSLSEAAAYEVDPMNRQTTLTDAGKERFAWQAEPLTGQWRVRLAREELVGQALVGPHLSEREQDDIIDEGDIRSFDEFTGRVMPDRTRQGGLHQMIEAKEGLAVTGRKVTLASITCQRFFRRHIRLAGMTGTGFELSGNCGRPTAW